MKISHEYLMELAALDQKINYTMALLAAPKFKNISICFFTERNNGEPDYYHNLRQENFDFSLTFELTKMLNEQLDFLHFKKETLLNNREQFETQLNLQQSFNYTLNDNNNEQ